VLSVVVLVVVALLVYLFYKINKWDKRYFQDGLTNYLFKESPVFMNRMSKYFVCYPTGGAQPKWPNETENVTILKKMIGDLQNRVEDIQSRVEKLSSFHIKELDPMGHDPSRSANSQNTEKTGIQPAASPDVANNAEANDKPGETSGQMTKEQLLKEFGNKQAEEGGATGESVNTDVKKEQQKQSAPQPSTHYVSVPEKDGTFKNLKEKQEWDSLYVLRTIGDSANATKATLDMCNNPDMFKTAIGTPQLYLNPVCDYSSNPPSNASKISVINKGIVERKSLSELWKIVEDQKLKIKFS
jgi:hypothetical protein